MRPTENIFSLDALEGAQVAFAFASELNQPLARVWETAADTDRLNRAAGLPPMEFDRTTHDDGVRLRASLPLLGMKVSFEAPLTTIRAPHGYAIERTFKGGAVELYRVTWTFESLDVKRTKATIRFEARVRPLVRYALPVLRLVAEREIRSMLTALETLVQSDVTVHVGTTSAADDRIERAAETLRRHHDASLVEALETLLVTGDDFDVAAMRPRGLAHAWGTGEAKTVAFLFAAVDAGLLRQRWALLCPSCRVPSLESDDLGSVGGGEQHCDLCAIDFAADMQRNVELIFVPDPSVRSINHMRWCNGGPGRVPHVLRQDGDVSHDAPARWRLPEDERELRIFASGGLVVRVQVDDAAPSEGVVDLERGQISTVTFAPGALVTVRPPEGFRGFLRLEREAWRSNAITARELFLMPAARGRVVPGTLRSDARLSLGRVAVLFSDLVGSTAFYETAGDAEACAFVLEHFDVVRRAVASTNGSVLKTIGDAVLVLYNHEDDAALGALAVHRAVHRHLAERGRLGDLGLKLAVHAGSGFLVREGDRLDVYGRSVNRAARLESQANAGEVLFVEEAFEALPHRVKDELAVVRRFSFEAKGVREEMRAVACHVRR